MVVKFSVEVLDLYKEVVNSSNRHLDAKIHFEHGSVYIASFYTVNKLRELVSLSKGFRPVEFIIGSRDLIILEDLTEANIYSVIHEIIKNEDYWDIFTPVNDKANAERIQKQ